jgi:hypothetical protein
MTRQSRSTQPSLQLVPEESRMTSQPTIPQANLIWSMPDHPAILAMKRHYQAHGAAIDELIRRAHGIEEAGMAGSLVTSASKRPCDVERLRGGSEVIVDTLLGAIGRTLRDFDDARSPADLDAALRWHAARLTDLVQALPRS